MNKKLTLLTSLLILVFSTSFAQTEIEQNFTFGVNILTNQGWEINGFTTQMQGGRNILGSDTDISSNPGRFIRTPWMYLTPGEFEVQLKSRISNSSKKNGFQPTITLIDIFDKRTTYNLPKYENSDLTDDLEYEFDITARGFYRIEIGQLPISGGGSDTIWELHEIEFEVENGDIQFDKEFWSVKMNKSNSIKKTNTNTDESIFFVGDSITFEQTSVIQTSTDKLGLDTVTFDIVYSELIKLKKIELWVNDELIAYTNDLISWNKTPFACGCPRDISMTENGNFYTNKLKIVRGRNNDVIKIRTYGIADKIGSFDVSIQYMGGTALNLENTNRVIGGNSSIISFAAQEEEIIPIEGDDEPVTTSGTIIPFGTQPVELISFTCNTTTNSTILNWSTALEINNDFFSIERSKDGINFIEIGKVKGNGSISGRSEYTFEDTTVGFGTWYYRLVQYDYDGTSKIYSIIRIVMKPDTDAKFQIIGNPTNGNRIVFTLQGIAINEGRLVINDSKTGAVVFNIELNKVSNDGNVHYIDGLNLTKGMYFVRIAGNSTLTSKLIVN